MAAWLEDDVADLRQRNRVFDAVAAAVCADVHRRMLGTAQPPGRVPKVRNALETEP